MPLEQKIDKKSPEEKKAEIELKAKIKLAENTKRQEAMKKAAPKGVQKVKMDYDSWYALRSGGIPKQHLKEIVWADFSGRGLDRQEECSIYDEALDKYGVKLFK